jgi:hypothetical protein
LAGLRSRRQKYVAEVPVSFYGWTQKPSVTHRTYRKHLHCGSVRKTPRCKADSPAPKAVEEYLQSSPELSRQRWRKFHVKDGEKGPQVWEAKHVWFYPHDGEGMPLEPVHLLVARNVLAPQQIKYFIAFAPRETPLEVLLLVAFSRCCVERCFEDQKTELGFDHFEGRTYVGLLRHQLLTAVTHLFLSRMTLLGREKNPQLTVCQLRTACTAVVQSKSLPGHTAQRLLEHTANIIRNTQRRLAASRRSHHNHTVRRLSAQKIHVNRLRRCLWEPDS